MTNCLPAELIGSEFLGKPVLWVKITAGFGNEDMTQLTFENESLAAVLSFDVLEHIPDYRKALREVYRCLIPGGKFIMTAPFNIGALKTLKRAELSQSGEIRHLLPPEYHGDPINPEKGVLCFQTFGWDILDIMREIGFVNVAALDYWKKERGYLGTCILFEAHKPKKRNAQ